MQEKSSIKKKILQFIEYKGTSKYKFYQDTGITRGVLDQNNGMTEENIARFLACFPDVNADWLLSGKGNMLKTAENANIGSGQQIIGSGNITTGNHNSNIDNRQYYSDSPDVLRAQVEEKDRLLYENDERLREKDERLREKDAYIAELKELISELKGKK